MNFSSLVVSGGGIRGIAALGALHYFSSLDRLNELKTYVGTSIGSVICLLLVCGYTPMEILDQFIKIDAGQEIKADVWNLTSTYGLISIDNLSKQIYPLIRKKMDVIPTLSQLEKITGKHLVVVVANVSKRQPEYLSSLTNPNLSCLDAIKMSCNIPLFFQKIVYQGSLYVDGGLVDNFPIKYVDDGTQHVLGINMDSDEKDVGEDNILKYIYKIIMMPSHEICKLKMTNISQMATIVNLTINTIPIDITMDRDEKMAMFVNGFNEAKLDDELAKEWEWD